MLQVLTGTAAGDAATAYVGERRRGFKRPVGAPGAEAVGVRVGGGGRVGLDQAAAFEGSEGLGQQDRRVDSQTVTGTVGARVAGERDNDESSGSRLVLETPGEGTEEE